VLGLAAAVALAAASCSTVEYYWQGARGQVEMLARARPIEQVVDDPAVDPRLKSRLGRIQAIRQFATAELGLPDNGAYRSYADLDRPYVVWNVVAAPELSLVARKWCFPVAGCVTYRGFFAERDASAEAARLRAGGYDVYVAGIPAYSTLGFFDDPVLNTFVDLPEHDLARLLFHELAHQVVYVADDSTFNESFATAVEEAGVERWLARHGTAAAREQHARSSRLREDFRGLVARTTRELEALYASELPDEAKRARKREVFAAMTASHLALKAGPWNGYAGYDGWFARGPNNASLAAVALYSEQVPEFRALLEGVGGDLPRFYQAVRRIAAAPRPDRAALLGAAACEAPCPSAR
jgi:predicted aminopeptidase